MVRRVTQIASMVAAVCVAASARDAAGLLDTIIMPNEGAPAIVQAGMPFDAILTSKCRVSLRAGTAEIPLAAAWSTLPGERYTARCTVPDSTAPGVYAIAVAGEGADDSAVRAVWIVDEFPETYTIAHLTDTHIGSDRHSRASTDIFRELIQHVNSSDAAFAVITGDLTEGGEAAQFQQFLEVLNTCTKPTYVCSGNHDRQGLHYEEAFGPPTYWFTFGAGDHEDGYLVFDTKDFVVAGELDGQDALLQRYRRAIMPCRWRIGLTHRYELDMGMRSQLTLFVDDPLDYLIYGHWHRENSSNEEAMPWPDIRATVTPAAINGSMRMFTIGPAVEGAGIVPGPVLNVVDVGKESSS